MMTRQTIMPNRQGCPKGRGWRRLHQWEHRHGWNGNSRQVLPFTDYPYGVARSGWRCYNCGRFVWDESDRAFALEYAFATGLLPQAKELGIK